MSLRKLFAVVAVAFSLAGCATQNFYTSDKLTRSDKGVRILMMPPDVQLFELTAGGQAELNAEWTGSGRSNVKQAVIENLGTIKAKYVEFQPPAEDDPAFLKLDQLQKLHGAVGATIAVHHAGPIKLPAKDGKFEWSLGPAVAELGQHADADYALFVYVRDSYTSPGRAAMKAVAAILFGVYIPGGMQTGYASLVDLKTGDVVWYNRLLPREDGDLRTFERSKSTVALLLDNMPK
ncbi:MAG TPA: hypothetical protein VLL76_03060 [Candidatus Omnitrophota bacterium]|nr:hypothetical protein [Candidatus Omnitrophota bacterium]